MPEPSVESNVAPNPDPISDTGKSILGSILGGPIRPDELRADADPEVVKKVLADQKPAEDENNFDITKEEEPKKEEPKVEPKKDEPKKEENPANNPAKVAESDEGDKEAEGKVKNIKDARKLYKTWKKDRAELDSLKKEKEGKDAEIKTAKDELEKLKADKTTAPEEIAAQAKELAELKAEREYVLKKQAEVEERAAAIDIESTEPWERQVSKPLRSLGKDLEDFAQSVTEDPDEQNQLMQAIGRAINIEDPKARRKALDELTAPLTQSQTAEVISIAKEYRKIDETRKVLKGNSQDALKMIKEKEEGDRKAQSERSKGEFLTGAREAREALAKMYPLLARKDLPEAMQKEITDIEETMEKLDPSKLPPKEVAKFIEGYYKIKLVSDAARNHIDAQSKAIKGAEEQKTAFEAKIADLEKEIADLKAQGVASDATRPNLSNGSEGTTEPTGPQTAQDLSRGLLAGIGRR